MHFARRPAALVYTPDIAQYRPQLGFLGLFRNLFQTNPACMGQDKFLMSSYMTPNSQQWPGLCYVWLVDTSAAGLHAEYLQDT